MSLRILGGEAKGTTLSVPPGQTIRPTSVMLRRRLFDYCQDVSAVMFIDACAGSGAMGLEAWSRGVSSSLLIEFSKPVYKILQKNVFIFEQRFKEVLSLRPIKIIQQNSSDWFLKSAPYWIKTSCQNKKIIIYLDPPYAKIQIYVDIIEAIKKLKKVITEIDSSCEIWIESDEKEGLTQSKIKEEFLSIDKVFQQGSKFVAIVRL